MSVRVYLVRHGATAFNLCRPYKIQGRAQDLPLDATGRLQADRAAAFLADVALTAVYCSPLRRAFETAATIAAAHDLDPVPIDALAEADVGRWEGLTWDEARSRDPEQHAAFLADPGKTPYAGGESFLDVQARVVPTIAALASSAVGPIAVVGHNVLNRAYLADVLGLPIARARALPQANGGISAIDYAEGPPRLVTLNACRHVEDLID